MMKYCIVYSIPDGEGGREEGGRKLPGVVSGRAQLEDALCLSEGDAFGVADFDPESVLFTEEFGEVDGKVHRSLVG